MSSICPCAPQVKKTRQLATTVTGTQPVDITICDCDRRHCTRDGCKRYSTVVGGTICAAGHRF